MEEFRVKKAASIMSSPVKAIRADAPAARAARMMREQKVSALPVLSETGKGVGLLSATDLVGWASDPSARDLRVRDLMTPGIVTAPYDASIARVARLMAEHRIHRVFIQSQGRIRGVVSALDVAMAVARASKED